MYMKRVSIFLKVLVLLVNIFGIVSFFIGLYKLATIEEVYTWRLWLWWFFYIVIPIGVFYWDLKYGLKILFGDEK